MNNNLVILFCLLILALFFWKKLVLEQVLSDTQQIVNKIDFLVESRISILKPAEKFFQAAMEERIPPSLRRPQPNTGVVNIKVSNLPY